MAFTNYGEEGDNEKGRRKLGNSFFHINLDWALVYARYFG